MSVVNTTLAAAISAAMLEDPTKINYSGTISSELGNSRRVRCFRDPNPAATNPAATGVEFLNMASTGPLTMTSGNISGFGILSDITKRLPANLSTGSCALVLEGNDCSITYTLGLVGSGKEFVLPSSPTGSVNEGYAFAPGSGTKAPRKLASGTGPKAPTLKPTTPTIVELVDWTDRNNLVVVGVARVTEATRVDDWVFQHPQMAAEIGDVAIYELDETIKWTAGPISQHFEYGQLMFVAANYNTESGVQLEQSLGSFVPLGRWATYPAMDTWQKTMRPDLGVWADPYVKSADMPFYTGRGGPDMGPPTNSTTYDSTFPRPFKVNLYTEAGYKNGAADRTPLFTHEMKAFNGKPVGPINGPEYSQELTNTEPFIPHFHCGQMLPWQSTRTKKSANAGQWFNGVGSYAYSADRGKSGDSCNPAIVQLKNEQVNATNQWFVMPPYPLKAVYQAASGDGPADPTYLNTYEDNPKDPNAFTNRDHYAGYRFTGRKYQPGSISGHDWRTGNGGMRVVDRAVAPTPLAIWASDQQWQRPEGLVPIRELVDDFGLAYFNHANHWIRDAKTFATVPKTEVLRGDWVFGSGYYGGGPYGAQGQPKGPQNTIDLSCPGNGAGVYKYYLDATGRLPFQGWQRDGLHSYTNAAWYAIMLNSPMHAFASGHDFNAQWMGSLGESGPTANPCNDGEIAYGDTFFMYRTGAWRWLSYTMQWVVGTEHPLGYSQEEVEARFQIELEVLYEKVYKPLYITNDQRPYYVALRNLGTPVKHTGGILSSVGGSLAFYYVHALVLMRQFGLEKVMKARSDKCKKVIEMMIPLFDKWIVDYVMDTDMRDSYYQIISNKGSGVTAADIPSNWAAQKAWLDSVRPVVTDLVTSESTIVEQFGVERLFKNFTLRYNNRCSEQEGNPHMYLQYLHARQDFWPEVPNTRIPAAITKMEGYYTQHDAAHAQNQAYEWKYLFASGGVLKAPTVLTT